MKSEQEIKDYLFAVHHLASLDALSGRTSGHPYHADALRWVLDYKQHLSLEVRDIIKIKDTVLEYVSRNGRASIPSMINKNGGTWWAMKTDEQTIDYVIQSMIAQNLLVFIGENNSNGDPLYKVNEDVRDNQNS